MIVDAPVKLPGLEALISFLGNPASYPHAPASVQVIQTHISCVAIAPPYVFKLKKPVDLGFLDFSTLEKRKFYCEQEVMLNRRLCNDTYEGVVPISYSDDGLTFGETGEIVDYVVKMNQLPTSGFLDVMLDDGKLGPTEVGRVADRLVHFYVSTKEKTTAAADIAHWGKMEVLRQSTDENFQQVLPFVGDLVPLSVFRAIQEYTEQFYIRYTTLFRRRVVNHHIRDCHGDLRLEHIHSSEKGLCIYDCIEFNERFRYIDIANDVAFLAMDLDHKGQPALADYLVQRVAERLKDPDILLLAPFYKCYRAIVRAKVTAMKSSEAEVDDLEREKAMVEARSFFCLALRYVLERDRPRVIVFMGRVGSGKSTQARLLAERTGWKLCSSDVIRKQLAGVPLTKRGTADERKELYGTEQTDKTYAKLLAEAREALENRQSIILDATFSSRERRDALRSALQEAGAICSLVEVTASDETIMSRLKARETSKDVVSDARLEDFMLIDRSYEAPDDVAETVHKISSDGELEDTAFQVLHTLMQEDGRQSY